MASLQAILMLRSPETTVSISDLPPDYIESPSLVVKEKSKDKKRAYKKREKTPTCKELKAIAAAAASFDTEESLSSHCTAALYSAAPLRYLTEALPSGHFYDAPESAPHSLKHPKLKRKNFSAPLFVLEDIQSESMNQEMQQRQSTISGGIEEKISLGSLSALTAAAIAMSPIDEDRSNQHNSNIPDHQCLEQRCESRSTVTSSESVDLASLVDLSPRCLEDSTVMFPVLPSPTNTDPETTSRESFSPTAAKDGRVTVSPDNLDSELSVDSHEYDLNKTIYPVAKNVIS